MPKGIEHEKNAKKKPKLTLMEKRQRKRDKKARDIGSVSDVCE